MNQSLVLHYIYDPMCGWCYAASPLVAQLPKISEISVQLHAGGMWTGDQIRHITPQLREFILRNDERIADISGIEFGAGYRNDLLANTDAVLDSEPPIRAIRTAERMGIPATSMLAEIQKAHFIQGREVNQEATLVDISQKLGLSATIFAQQFNSAYAKDDAQAHIEQTRGLMDSIKAQGFPTFVLENSNNQQWSRVPHTEFYGNPDAWTQWLKQAALRAQS